MSDTMAEKIERLTEDIKRDEGRFSELVAIHEIEESDIMSNVLFSNIFNGQKAHKR